MNVVPDKTTSLENHLRELLAPRPEIVFALIFGSYARGTANKLSDIDIAVYVDQTRMPPASPYGYASDLVVALQQHLKRRVDLVVLNEAPLVLRFHILQDGKLLFCREPQARVRFHEKTLREFLDFQPVLKLQAQYLRRRLANGSFGGAQNG